MTHIVDTVEDLTAQWFTSALRAGGTIASDVSVTSAKSALIGTGQLGLIARSELTYRADGGAPLAAPATLVVKLPSVDAGSRGQGAAMGVYESEVRFYHQIAPRLGRYVPRMHWGDVEPATGRFTLVIDDLSSVATVGDMVGGGTLAQAELAIAALATIQAPVWDDLALRDEAWLGIAKTEMLFGSVAPAFDVFAKRFGPKLDPHHLALAERLVPYAAGSARRLWQPPFVVVHGDYRLDNMLFGQHGSGAPAISVIDWQGACLGPPLLDAAFYLGSCLMIDERRAEQPHLLRLYHERLVAAGVQNFSFAEVEHSYRVGALYPFLLCIAAAVSLQQTERGDQMWAQLFTNSATIVADTDAGALLTA